MDYTQQLADASIAVSRGGWQHLDFLLALYPSRMRLSKAGDEIEFMSCSGAVGTKIFLALSPMRPERMLSAPSWPQPAMFLARDARLFLR
jgi:hypothetical protein